MKETDKFCPSCGNSVNGVAKTTPVGRKVCKGCGTNIDINFSVCPHCKKNPDTGATSITYRGSTNGWAIAGFVLSFFSPLLGIVFSALGMHKVDETGTGYWLSLFGIIISIVSVIISIIYWNRLWDAIMSMLGTI